MIQGRNILSWVYLNLTLKVSQTFSYLSTLSQNKRTIRPSFTVLTPTIKNIILWGLTWKNCVCFFRGFNTKHICSMVHFVATVLKNKKQLHLSLFLPSLGLRSPPAADRHRYSPAWVDFRLAFLISSSVLLLSFTSSCCVFISRSFCLSVKAFRALE